MAANSVRCPRDRGESVKGGLAPLSQKGNLESELAEARASARGSFDSGAKRRAVRERGPNSFLLDNRNRSSGVPPLLDRSTPGAKRRAVRGWGSTGPISASWTCRGKCPHPAFPCLAPPSASGAAFQMTPSQAPMAANSGSLPSGVKGGLAPLSPTSFGTRQPKPAARPARDRARKGPLDPGREAPGGSGAGAQFLPTRQPKPSSGVPPLLDRSTKVPVPGPLDVK